MERIISYDELPYSNGETLYLRQETDIKLYLNLIKKGYKIIDNIVNAKKDTIYVTGARQSFECNNTLEYKELIHNRICNYLNEKNITKPNTEKFSYYNLIEHKYKIPFVLKNENLNGGKEKFLIATEEDYENLIKTCKFLIEGNKKFISSYAPDDIKSIIDYDKYLNTNFTIQEYINTPTNYNTTIRLLTTPSNDLLYSSLKYNEKKVYLDNTTLIGYFLKNVYPLSTKSIVSNTMSGGKNIMLDENEYNHFEQEMLKKHNINEENYFKLVDATKKLHNKFNSELGIICAFDYIYDEDKQKWFLLEYHSKPMVGDYSLRQGLNYKTKEDKIASEGRVRATSLKKVLKR